MDNNNKQGIFNFIFLLLLEFEQEELKILIEIFFVKWKCNL